MLGPLGLGGRRRPDSEGRLTMDCDTELEVSAVGWLAVVFSLAVALSSLVCSVQIPMDAARISPNAANPAMNRAPTPRCSDWGVGTPADGVSLAVGWLSFSTFVAGVVSRTCLLLSEH